MYASLAQSGVQLVAVDLNVVGDPQVDGDDEGAEEGADGAAEHGAHPGVGGGDPAEVQEQVKDSDHHCQVEHGVQRGRGPFAAARHLRPGGEGVRAR